ncbi:MAG TPA: hypothetical protein VEM96_01340 [Pyrinomonadaceae bacterium]|nr:hypothetical protein [Pyrinomonadaceae bacterium]
MDYLVTVQGIRIVGGLAFLFILYSAWMGKMTAQGLPAGYSNPVLALELVKDKADIEKIVQAESGKVVNFLKRSTYKDFGFIFVYALLFIALSLLLSQMNSGWMRYVGWLAAACAALAAILDLVEDRGMLIAIAGEASDSLANSIRYPSLAKWGLLFIFALLVGTLLVARRDFFVIPAVFLFVAALAGLCGVLLNLFRPRYYWTFPVAIVSLGIGILIIAFTFTFWPAKLLTKVTR